MSARRMPRHNGKGRSSRRNAPRPWGTAQRVARRRAATLLVVMVLMGVVAMMCGQAVRTMAVMHRAESMRRDARQARQLIQLGRMDLRQHGRPHQPRQLSIVLPDGTTGRVEVAPTAAAEVWRIRAWLGDPAQGAMPVSETLTTAELEAQNNAIRE